MELNQLNLETVQRALVLLLPELRGGQGLRTAIAGMAHFSHGHELHHPLELTALSCKDRQPRGAEPAALRKNGATTALSAPCAVYCPSSVRRLASRADVVSTTTGISDCFYRAGRVSMCESFGLY